MRLKLNVQRNLPDSKRRVNVLQHLATSRNQNRSSRVLHRRSQENRSDLLRLNHHHKVAERVEARSPNSFTKGT